MWIVSASWTHGAVGGRLLRTWINQLSIWHRCRLDGGALATLA
jgi:hypothetical protein